MTSGVDFSVPAPIPLPNDPSNRYWLELAGANPSLVDQVRPALVTFVAFDKDKSIISNTNDSGSTNTPTRLGNMVGTGFVVGVGSKPDLGLVLTAKHNFEGIHRVQTPVPHYAPSALFVPERHMQPILDPKRLKVMWANADSASLMNATWGAYTNSSDIACCVVVPQNDDLQPFHPVTIPIDTRVPSVGEIVHIVSIDDMNATELVEPEDRHGIGQVLRLYRRVSIRRGTVTGVYPNGFGQYKWPCFTTTVPITGGMSGGFVYIPRDGEIVSACGVVCADLDPDKSKSDQTICGISVIGCTWPALALRLPEHVPAPNKEQTRSLLEMVQSGHIPMPVGGIDRFRI